jgi:hypothetical protein
MISKLSKLGEKKSDARLHRSKRLFENVDWKLTRLPHFSPARLAKQFVLG